MAHKRKHSTPAAPTQAGTVIHKTGGPKLFAGPTTFRGTGTFAGSGFKKGDASR